jgi:Leucine-rich repeat (LRR) protein
MPNLEILYCHNTQITNLSNMSKLKYLKCSNTLITSLPDMPKLEYLNCTRTQITNLPDMPNLETLICVTIDLEDYKKICKIRKILLFLASLQVIKNRSILSNFKGFNIARIVSSFI